MARTISAIIKFIIGSFLIIIGIKASQFFYYYDRIPHHEWYIAPCLIFIVAGLMLLWRIVKPANRSLREIVQDVQQDIQKTGTKYTIDLSTCRIVPAAEEDGTTGNYSWNIVAGEDKSAGPTPGHVIVCDMEIAGRSHHFVSEATDLEKIAITFKMTNQKTTPLYVDPMDPSRYYLDTRFFTQRVYH
ncbi:MAG: hypothetical protein JWO03_2948 [Bacteroidetes bacterium]|nr:hypothetical protein [Bacteroidota bacterium]